MNLNVVATLVIFLLAVLFFISSSGVIIRVLNWWKGKPSGSIACTWKRQSRFYWSCSSVVMNDATPLTPPSAWAELHFHCKQHTCTLHDPSVVMNDATPLTPPSAWAELSLVHHLVYILPTAVINSTLEPVFMSNLTGQNILFHTLYYLFSWFLPYVIF